MKEPAAVQVKRLQSLLAGVHFAISGRLIRTLLDTLSTAFFSFFLVPAFVLPGLEDGEEPPGGRRRQRQKAARGGKTTTRRGEESVIL